MTRRWMILALFLLFLSACDPDTPPALDCDITPEHEDCQTDDPMHGVTFHGVQDLVLPQYVFNERFWDGVSATDRDGNPLTLFVDYDIDFDVAGVYPITYRVELDDGTTVTTDTTLTLLDQGGTDFDTMRTLIEAVDLTLKDGAYAFECTTYNPVRGDDFERVTTFRFEYDIDHVRRFVDTNPVMTNDPHQSYLQWETENGWISYRNEGTYLIADGYPTDHPKWDLATGWEDLPPRYTTVEAGTYTFYLSHADLAMFAGEPTLLGNIYDIYRTDLEDDHVRMRFDVTPTDDAVELVVAFFNTDNGYSYLLEYTLSVIPSLPLDVSTLSQIGATALEKVDYGIVQGIEHNFTYPTQDDRFYKISIVEGMIYEVRTPWFDHYHTYDDQLQPLDLGLVTVPLIEETRYWFEAPYTGDLYLERSAYAYDIEETIPFFYDTLADTPIETVVPMDPGTTSYTATSTGRFRGVRLIIPVEQGSEYRFTFSSETQRYAFLNANSNNINGDLRYYNPTGDTIELILYDDVTVSWTIVAE